MRLKKVTSVHSFISLPQHRTGNRNHSQLLISSSFATAHCHRPTMTAVITLPRATTAILLSSVLFLAVGAAPNDDTGEQLERGDRSLVNTYPFNTAANTQQGGDHAHEHHEHGEHGNHGDHGDHGDHSPAVGAAGDLPDPAPARQGSDTSVRFEFEDVASARAGNDGKRCLNKVEMVEETEYDEIIQCDHSYDKRCHTTYVTTYQSQQEEECDDNFRKSCFIQYEKVAFNETVQICRNPLVKDCNVQGEDVCRTEYESECWTKYEIHEVDDDVVTCETVQERDEDEKCEDKISGYTTVTKCSKWPRQVCSTEKKRVAKQTPVTGCNKEPVTLCAPAGCQFKEGPQECYDKKQTVIQDAPKEQCTLEPQRSCKFVTKLVPQLEPSQECVDVPKEVCTRTRSNPRKIKKPVVKKWCYIPSAESGLA